MRPVEKVDYNYRKRNSSFFIPPHNFKEFPLVPVPHEVLGVKPDVSRKEIEKAYRDPVKKIPLGSIQRSPSGRREDEADKRDISKADKR